MPREGEKFVTTKYRVRPGVLSIVKYIEWKELRQDEDQYDKHILDTIVSKSLNDILQGKVKFKKDRYRKRKDRSLTFSSDTIHIINERHRELGCYKGELIEICLYIHALKNLTPVELELNQLNMWGIELFFMEEV